MGQLYSVLSAISNILTSSHTFLFDSCMLQLNKDSLCIIWPVPSVVGMRGRKLIAKEDFNEVA
jgi:hypothetical protein